MQKTKGHNGGSMVKRIAYVEGLDGQIEVLPDRVVIHRKGFINSLFYGMNSRREIPIGQISEVVFRDASRMKFGIIEFVRSGRSAQEYKGRGAAACVVKFNRKTARNFAAVKEKIFQLIDEHQRGVKH